jgi:hypothetical protein
LHSITLCTSLLMSSSLIPSLLHWTTVSCGPIRLARYSRITAIPSFTCLSFILPSPYPSSQVLHILVLSTILHICAVVCSTLPPSVLHHHYPDAILLLYFDSNTQRSCRRGWLQPPKPLSTRSRQCLSPTTITILHLSYHSVERTSSDFALLYGLLLFCPLSHSTVFACAFPSPFPVTTHSL